MPADALAYVNLSIDPSRGAVEQATALAARFPDYRRLLGDVERRLGGIASGGAPVDFARDLAPWLGSEAALAVLNTTTSTAGSLVVLDVSNHRRGVGSLLFLDFSQLLSLGGQMGLTHSARLSALGADLEKISAAGLTSTSGKTDTTAELFLQIP